MNCQLDGGKAQLVPNFKPIYEISLDNSLYICDTRNKNAMSRDDKNIIGYTVALISEFANHFGIHPRQAYAYLKRHKGLEHLQLHYGILHTQTFADTIESLAEVCANNGGGLR